MSTMLLSLWLLISCSIQCIHSSLPLDQPTIIEILDGATFTLKVEYCEFTALDRDSRIVIAINTRCYCYDTEENKNSIVYRSNPTNIKPATMAKPSNASNKALICGIPGPTLMIKNGTEFNINLENNLVGSSIDPDVSYPYEMRNWPDVTNLHTHGLHVSPEWDNVFEAVNPGTSKLLHYVIPSDHYPGSHWYHAHFHQATELQIQGGLFGAVIVDTDEAANEFYRELILHFHFMFFYTTSTCDCNQDVGELMNEYCYIIGFWDLCSLCFNWCANPDTRLIESGYSYSAESMYADESGRVDLPLLNGQYQPIISIAANRWYRLNLVNSNGQYYTQLFWPSQCEIYIIGADGIYFKNGARNMDAYPFEYENIFDPGSRNDIAIRCPLLAFGEHHVLYSQNTTAFGLLPRFPHEMVAFTIDVVILPDADIDDFVVAVQEEEPPSYAIPPLPDYLTDTYDVAEGEELAYAVTDMCPCWTYPGGEYNLKCHWDLGRFGLTINNQMWSGPETPILYVCRGLIYEFAVDSLHPLHLHTSPFQIMQDLPSEGMRVGFLAMAGDFRDTTSTDFGDFYIRYQATDFVGPIVTHCHFLPHEDEGMIVYFQIVDCIDGENRPYMDVVNKTLNPFGYDPLKNKHVPDECDIFRNRFE